MLPNKLHLNGSLLHKAKEKRSKREIPEIPRNSELSGIRNVNQFNTCREPARCWPKYSKRKDAHVHKLLCIRLFSSQP